MNTAIAPVSQGSLARRPHLRSVPDIAPTTRIFALLGGFWPELSVEGARRSLQVAASRVRAALDRPGATQSVLRVQAGTYRARLENAAALWTGEPLPEERYEDWTTAWRERLVDLYREVLSGLAGACRRVGDHAGAIAAARKLVELDPFDEGGHRKLMAAYAREGRRAAALRQYLECRRVLVEELGIEPAEATSRLQVRILNGEDV